MLQITTRPDSADGVWYYLDTEDSHELIALLASSEASEEDKIEAKRALEGRPRARLRPLTNAQYTKERSRSTILQTAFRAKGKGRKATMVLQHDVATQERAFAVALLRSHVLEVGGITARDARSGEVRDISTIEDLLEVIDASSSEEAASIVDELHDALRDSSELEKGLGES